MSWRAEANPVEGTWAGTAFRDDDAGRVLWLSAGPDVAEPGWLVQTIAPRGETRTVAAERPVVVADAVGLAPEVAHDILRQTRAALERYAGAAPGRGEALAEELRDAVRELERQDVARTSGGTHTKRGEDVVPPVEYGEG